MQQKTSSENITRILRSVTHDLARALILHSPTQPRLLEKLS